MEKVDKTTIRNFLCRIWAFERLDPSHLDLLSTLVRVRQLKPNQVLWLQGQQITHFTIVFNGQLRSLRRSSSGSEKLVSVLPPGRHFGLAEMITASESAVTLIADRPTTIFTMDHAALRRQLLSNAEICYRLMQTMARAIFYLTGELEKVSFENVRTRLARLLLKGSRSRQISQDPIGPPGTLLVSHEELAVQIGVSRETVSRVLADFTRQGLIKTAYRRISVIDRHGLEECLEAELL